jgi:ABC-type antimicrobial peptide transport system permease subunit
MPDAPRPRVSHVKQILITLVCGVLLGLGSCFGFLNTINFNGPAKTGNTLYVIGFVVGVALVVYAGVWALVAIIIAFLRAVRSEQ